MLVLDSALIVTCLLAAFSIRLGYWFWPNDDLMLVIIGAPIIAAPIFIRFGLYRAVIRYIGFKALWAIINAVSLYALIWGVIGFMAALDGIPRSVIIINWILSLMAIGGLRIIARLIISGDVHILSKKINSKQKQVLVYGAGDAGVQLVSGLEYSSEYSPVGFIDDATDLQSNQIRGLNIYSADDISTLINRFNLDEILIAIPSLSRSDRNAMLEKLEPYPVEVRLLPGVSELADGKVNIDDLREVDIKDLLGRNIVEPNKDLLGKNITNRVVVVTGAGGSIGSELCRQIVLLKPKALILYEMSELALYNIEKELSSIGINAIDIYPILGSVNNKSRLSNVFKRFDVDTVYHAAAYKHVPMVEFNTTEGVNNNVFGTLNCAQAAIDEGVETFVLISTDKAVRPTNTMGATKRSAELILQALSVEQNSTKFTMVRFGNVLESSGSVIPLFKQQIKSGGPVTVTDKDIIRYFMTIPEAVELVIQAGAMGTGGDVFVLDMGKPVRINDLAKKMIRLSGLEVKDESNPDGDIEINYTGLRPGEKLFEELLIGDNVDDTNHALIVRAEEEMLTWEELEPIFDELSKAVKDCDQELLRSLLKKIVPGFQPQCDIEDILYQK
ncbi:UDP-N-acetylglucosamine 4,6-dehydratase [hydrothermal vent metagenome]|uniref:UDP-N-acetylglucosamine 4,6-dehydratase n=1 Tax=hydrothermal vent metagenome TaxID=652676 RepID=A0A1W1DA84_9ZZZZ